MSQHQSKKTTPVAMPGQVRVIAGRLKGSKLEVSDVSGLRPTPDRIRETLFNWLMPWIEGARCLDLFAGTGALGIEAVSRWAGEVVMVERNEALVAAIKNNLARLGAQANVVCGSTESWLRSSAQPFDIVFIDPPFTANLWEAIAEMLENRGWLTSNALIYVESPRAEILNFPATWRLHREAYAGRVRSALYRRDLGVQ